ncbi:type II toxin-antitoxin system VapC family toxin [Acidithiobacillus thiooxidans]|uniref:Ribonuclease VapC n=1 Tax=Acidithiobacillus thiooxidans TaxID=930 RepID=A0A1C2IKH2_ACITH|nr:PIN domain-containing protein [Acidithiobacillus thiooxidans]MBU2811543.1 type II toxin-antitoxin system VapC family toxin [Acidithiobacillus thiooxidans]OCX76517.1 nuclease [Acidithiobacillus thiooxidans]OCX76725.1 nuclease [Acidithiobacillus thiooxidans]OCX81189.1 nuclease [Acidithiobacillus thiooxidans]OCX89538.1 nuclease [Acidithiobacillus thiooxidans]
MSAPVWILDTSALLTLRDDEPGADRVAELLEQAWRGDGTCCACFMTAMELLYRVWKDEGEPAARLAYEQAQSLPIVWIHESPELLEAAAEIKAKHRLSLADAWIAATTLLRNGVLVHKDPEFSSVHIQQEAMPFK